MAFSKEIRQKIYNKYDGHCAYCGKGITKAQMQIDHLIPIYRNWTEQDLKRQGVERGSNDIDNLMPSCRQCNFRKDTLTLEKFREELVKQRDRLLNTFAVRQSVDYGLLEVHQRKVEFYFEKKKDDKGRITRNTSIPCRYDKKQ